MDHAEIARRRTLKKVLAWLFWGVNLGLIVAFWLSNATSEITSGELWVVLHALARLFGLLATFCALTQFVLMGRVGWLEPIFGLDRLAIFHRRNGIATISLILAHSGTMTIAHGLATGNDPIKQTLQLAGMPYVFWAMLAEMLFIATVFLSIYIVRKHLKFETWYAVHLLNYLAIVLVPWHQLVNGSDFLLSPWFKYYWIGLYVFVLINVIWWRFAKPVLRSPYFGFTVEKTVQETPTATSVYITGNHLEKFKARGGQFVMVRFFQKGFVWQEHPFSLSQLPSGQYLRLTIRQLGDFTNMVPQLKPGTRVWVSGPYGSFTHERQRTNKILYIAGGIGITPIRSMIEAEAKSGQKTDTILLYGNRTEADTALLDELQSLGAQLAMPVHNVLSEQKDYIGEKGYIDKEKIARLVPDVKERDIFLCGPPPMMAIVKKTLRELGVSDGQVHYERFSLHKD